MQVVLAVLSAAIPTLGRALAVALTSFLTRLATQAFITEVIIRLGKELAKRTETTVDDDIIAAAERASSKPQPIEHKP
jgi:hypothetical protein